MRVLHLLAALALLATPLWADFEGTASGTVRCGSKVLAGADILVEVDPLWGRPNAEDLKVLRRGSRGNSYPEDISGSATTKCDEKGAYSVKITVIADNSKLPKSKVNVDGKRVDAVWVSLKITASVAGYRTTTYTHQTLTEGGETKSDLALWQLRSYEVQLIYIDRKPAAGVRVAMYGSSWTNPGGKDKELPVYTTDAQGRLVISESEVPGERLRLRILDEGLAFDANAPFWKDDIQLEGGRNDGGKLTVVPGSTLKAQFVDADTDKGVAVRYAVSDKGMRVSFYAEATDGHVDVSGLPAGEYNLHASQIQGYDPYRQDGISLKAKEVRDLGKLKIEPHRALEVIALGDDGSEIPQYSVLLTQLEPTPGNRPGSRNDTCTPKRRSLSGLSSGQWRVTVTADSFIAATTTVTLPDDKSVTLTLQRGGTLAPGGEHRAWSRVWAVLSTAPCYERISKMAATDVQRAFRDGRDPTGVYPPPGEKGGRAGRVAVPAGTYLVFGKPDYDTYFRVDNVVVRLGETTTLTADPKAPAELAVALSMQGKAETSQTLLAMRTDERDPAKAVVARTGADGIAKFKTLALGTWCVVTKREFDWLNRQQSSSFGRGDAALFGFGRTVTLSPGDRPELAIDLYSPARIWLTVKVKLGKGATMESAALKDVFSDTFMPVSTAVGVDGVFEFGPVRAGTYDFVDGDGVGNSKFWRRLEVNAPPAQTIEFELNLYDVTVTLRRPKGMEGNQFSTYLRPVCDEPRMAVTSASHGTSKTQPDGKVIISGVPGGVYVLTSWAET